MTTTAGAVREGDPDDVEGLLDISLTRFVDDEGIGQLTIVTYDDWGCSDLRANVETNLKWLLDGRGDRRFDLVGTFECRRNTLFFDLRSRDGSNQYEPIEVSRRGDRRTALVRFPLDLPELRGDHLTMIATSRDRRVCESDCYDRAPDRGRMRASSS
jgi:hypothetical protein